MITTDTYQPGPTPVLGPTATPPAGTTSVAVIPKGQQGTLPFTGSDVVGLSLIAALVIGVGLAVVRLGRKRPA